MLTEQQIPDKLWLDRIKTAYAAYPLHSEEVAVFISWLYKQYGIIEPKVEKK